MERRRWLNNSQPQTLQIAVLLFYLSAAFAILAGAVFVPILLIIAVAQVAAGFGIANERKWGYVLGVVVALGAILLNAVFIWLNGIGSVYGLLLNIMFEVALAALVLHPQSREYQRIWFK